MNSTEKQHVESNGANCPFCDSSEIEGQAFDVVSDGVAGQEMICHDCSGAWSDVYKLIGFDVTEMPETN